MDLKYVLLAAAAGVAMSVGSAAQAATLLSLTNLGYTDADYDLSFVADDTTTQLNIAGYNLPSFVDVSNNAVMARGDATNLLGATWSFTPAAIGSDAYTYNDGTGVDAVGFGSVVIGEYDTFSQSFATVVGQTYDYTFHVSNYADPSALDVSTGALAAVPEPASWALMLAGFGFAGAAVRGRRRATA